MAILTNKLRWQIKKLRAKGATYREIARKLGVHNHNIYMTLNPEAARKVAVDGSRKHALKKRMEAKGQDFYAWLERLGEHR